MKVTSIVNMFTSVNSIFTVNSIASQKCVYLLLLIFTKFELFDCTEVLNTVYIYIYICHSKVVMQVTSIVHRFTSANVSIFTAKSIATQTCVYLLLLIFTNIK